ncbi:hypothetical protein ABZ891_03690 [Streptomyces sp. NPDC047023]|uniref:hypothetical protein n=1 Tax=Streptomyces sp. NPDC047023 TaxID=3155139 RepID=UPI0033F6F891
MIGEPELDGEQGWEGERAGPHGAGHEEAERARGARPPWGWVLLTAAAVSVLWGVGLYAFGDRLAAPPLSYRATKNLCEDFRAEALGRIAGDLHRNRKVNQESGHPAVDGAVCLLQSGQEVSTLVVRAHVDLHKKTDPEAEFDVPALGEGIGGAAPDSEPVPGLGERAYVTREAHGAASMLKVLDGGAVFTVRASGFVNNDGVPAADPAVLRKALIDDTRRLMADLKERKR